MPTICSFFGIIIQMYWRDHAPPHFHVIYGEYEAAIEIRELRVLTGWLPKRTHALVREWAADHRAELLEDWELCRQMKTPKPILPLE
ncbi:MAG TPA: DUF4160 domain-containing protein [Gemmatimonadaceae bacterium]|nr:DUF4160 domain-containing protein [Gemmatimonadaceae bacterium]